MILARRAMVRDSRARCQVVSSGPTILSRSPEVNMRIAQDVMKIVRRDLYPAIDAYDIQAKVNDMFIHSFFKKKSSSHITGK